MCEIRKWFEYIDGQAYYYYCIVVYLGQELLKLRLIKQIRSYYEYLNSMIENLTCEVRKWFEYINGQAYYYYYCIAVYLRQELLKLTKQFRQ